MRQWLQPEHPPAFAGRILRAVIFDLDDTLVDWRAAETGAIAALAAGPLAGLGVTAQQVRDEYALVTAENQERFRTTRQWMYIRERLAVLVQRLGVGHRVDAHRLGLEFADLARSRLRLLDGAFEAIAAARQPGRGRQRKVAILTNGPSLVQRPKVEAFGIEPKVDYVAISGEIGAWKPEPAAFLHVLGKLGVAPADALMVGDSVEFDLKTAKALGMATALVDPGGRKPDVADVVVRTPRELIAMLQA